MKKETSQKIGIILFMFAFIFSIFAVQMHAETPLNSNEEVDAEIYYNIACGMCKDYLNEITSQLDDEGITYKIYDYVNDRENRKKLLSKYDELGIPVSLQAHFVTFINDSIVLSGHVPKSVTQDLLDKNIKFDKLLVYQDEMSDGVFFDAWNFKGEPQRYDINDAISKYKEYTLTEKINNKEILDETKLLPVVITSGLLAGIHPCTIAVLLFFLAFLFTINANRKKMLKVGGAYILGIFAAFSLIGIGLLKVMVFSIPMFAEKLAGVLVIILGLINIYNYFAKGKKFSLGLPKASKQKIAGLVERSTVPASFLLGIFVGVCSFGCTAGIYFAILGLMIKSSVKGVTYLTIYNLMFIIPLVVILLFSSNEKVVGKMQTWQKSETKLVKLIGGIIMLLLGAYLLF